MGNPSFDTLKETINNLNDLATLEMALFFSDKLQMLAVVAGSDNKVLHFLAGNSQRRVLLVIVQLKMIIII